MFLYHTDEPREKGSSNTCTGAWILHPRSFLTKMTAASSKITLSVDPTPSITVTFTHTANRLYPLCCFFQEKERMQASSIIASKVFCRSFGGTLFSVRIESLTVSSGRAGSASTRPAYRARRSPSRLRSRRFHRQRVLFFRFSS